VVRDVARQADVTPSLIYRWRRDLRATANSFAQVLVAPAGDGAAILPVAVIEIDGRRQSRRHRSWDPHLGVAREFDSLLADTNRWGHDELRITHGRGAAWLEGIMVRMRTRRLPRKLDLDRRCRRADGGSSSDSPLEEDRFEPSVPRVESICLDTVLPPGAVGKACSEKHCILGGIADQSRPRCGCSPGSLLTLCWREMDSNFKFRAK
jgi:hypothetical protein